MNEQQKHLLAQVLSHVLATEERSFEEYADEHGVDSDKCNNHLYNIARTAWAEFELDFPTKGEVEMTDPKNIHDGLRRLQCLVNGIEIDLTRYLDGPQDYTPEYFEDLLLSARDAMGLIVYVRSELKGEVK